MVPSKALQQSVVLDDVEKARVLLACPRDWGRLPEDGDPLLFRALANGTLAMVKLLHEHGAPMDQRSRRGWDGWDALLGGRRCHPALWDWFLAHGPDPLSRSSRSGLPLLHLVALHAPDHPQWALEVISLGGSWGEQDRWGRTVWEVLPLECREVWEKLTW